MLAKRVALAAVVLAFTLPASAVAANWPDARLDAAATAVAGFPVQVWCESSWADWIHVGDSFGQDWSYVAGFTFLGRPVIYISPDLCRTLHYLLNGESVGTIHAALALLVLAHEAVHQSGITDEGETDCTALPLVPDLAADYFGVPRAISESYTGTLRRKIPGQVVRLNGRVVRDKKGRIVRTPPRFVTVQAVRFQEVVNPWLARLETDALRWHRAAPAEYQGGC